jgi:hypothetical protein
MAIPKMYQPPSKDAAAAGAPATPSPAKTARKDFVPACASKIPAQYKPKVADSPASAVASPASPAKKAPANFVPSCASKIPDQYKPKAGEPEPAAPAAASPAKKAAKNFVPACASKIPAQYKPAVARGAEAEAEAAAAAAAAPKKVAPAGFVPRCATTPKKAADEPADAAAAAAASPAPADGATPKKTAPPGFVPRVAMAAKKTPSKAEADAAAAAAAAAESEADTKPKRVASAGFFERLAGTTTAARKAALDEAESKATADAAAASTADAAAADKPKRTADAATFARLSATPTKATARRDAEASPATPQQQVAKPRAPRSDGPSIFDRLTDVKTFTGSHKERFTPDGKGKGLDGRDRPVVDPLNLRSKARARKPSATSNDNAESPARDGPSIFDRLTDVKTFTGSHKERFTPDGKGKGLDGRDRPTTDPLNLRTKAKPAAAAASPSSSASTTDSPKRDGPSIFDRLTDVKTFTGSHKERFTSDGKGKGLDGRDRPTTDPLNLRTKAKPSGPATTTPVASDPTKPSIFDRLNKQDTAAAKARHTADEKASADAAAAEAANSPAPKAAAKPRDPNSPSIFDRLTQQTTAAVKARVDAVSTTETKVVDENGVDPEQAKRVMKKLHKIEATPAATPAATATATTTTTTGADGANASTSESIVVTDGNGATSSATVVTEKLANDDAIAAAVAEQTSF